MVRIGIAGLGFMGMRRSWIRSSLRNSWFAGKTADLDFLAIKAGADAL